MKNVYCIGEMLIDFVAERQGKDLTQAYQFTRKAGGAPANVAAAISKLGGQSYFVGAVGEDPFGTFLIEVMKKHKVSVEYVQQISTFTTLAFVSLAEDGERDFVFSRGADRELSYDENLSSQFNNEILHFGAATALLGGSLQKAYTRYLEDAISRNAFISFDPNYRTDLWKDRDAEFIALCKPFISKCHLAKFSLEEAFLLSGKTTLPEACTVLHNLGAKAICITLGKEGTYVSTKSYQTTVGSISVTPLDTTGAGDAFIGCLLKQLSLQEIPESVIEDESLFLKMVKRANICGAITTTNYGAIAALPDEMQLNSLAL
ncbi:carbohydrate kinase family protein [Ascidiimonas sp. W6]|uniref:carbohydrate kinase family protein n=1 Tax=Ascidiimonas meishanensis TaxID=3128903 RepID=UPI0030EC59A5